MTKARAEHESVIEPAGKPPRSPKQHDADAKALIMLICRMKRLAPSQLAPLLTVARSMMNEPGHTE